MATTIEFTIPSFNQVITNPKATLAIGAVLLLAAILAIVVVQLYKKHYYNKNAEKLAKHWIALWLTGSSAFFTALGGFVVFAQTNASMFDSIPFVKQHALEVVGIAYVLFNLSNTAPYKAVTKFLHKWTKTPTKVETVPAPQPDANQFV